MITEEKLAILKDEYITHDVLEDCVACKDVPEMLDTLSALWRVARRAENYINCVPAICNDECVDRLKEALAALRSEEKK